MVGVDQVMTIVVRAHQRKTLQRYLVELEASLSLTFSQRLHGLLQRRLASPVILDERLHDLLVHHLNRPVQFALPDKAGPQDGVSIHRRLPGLLETLHIQAVNIDPQLVDVVTGLLLVQGMEQHALLHRR
ncbi:hypothetical protein D3C80_1763020 [compost metagenome]